MLQVPCLCHIIRTGAHATNWITYGAMNKAFRNTYKKMVKTNDIYTYSSFNKHYIIVFFM